MMWGRYELEETILKAAENSTLWRTEKSEVEIDKDTLAIPIRLGSKREGYVFQGKSKLLLDTIVETEQGALGKPIEREMDQPFLMLGNVKDIEGQLVSAKTEDFAELGYKNEEEFFAKARGLLDTFFEGKAHAHGCRHLGGERGSIFAFPGETDELDVLVAKGHKLVYKTRDIVFVSNGSETILKNSSGVVLSHNGRSVIVRS